MNKLLKGLLVFTICLIMGFVVLPTGRANAQAIVNKGADITEKDGEKLDDDLSKLYLSFTTDMEDIESDTIQNFDDLFEKFTADSTNIVTGNDNAIKKLKDLVKLKVYYFININKINSNSLGIANKVFYQYTKSLNKISTSGKRYGISEKDIAKKVNVYIAYADSNTTIATIKSHAKDIKTSIKSVIKEFME